MMKKTLAVIALATLIGGCAGEATTKPMKQETTVSARDAIAKAEQMYQKADAMGAAWRDTNKMVAEAKKLAKEGKQAEAKELAIKAQHQSEHAIEQHKAQQDAGARLGEDA